MRKGQGRRMPVAAAVFLLALMLCVTVRADQKKPAVTAGCPSLCPVKVTVRISAKNGMVLSIPGCWDIHAITLEAEGSEKVYLGKERTEIAAGTETDLSGLVGKRTVVRDAKGRSLGSLTVLQGSEIPALFLEVDANDLKKVNRSKNEIITDGRAVYAEKNGTVTYDGGLAQLKGRGNNTFSYAKKPYQFKLREKTALSGMNPGKTWVLLANWSDVSLLRNQIVLNMSREIGLPYAVRCVQTDVWINGKYQGLYLLTEKIQIGAERIPVTNLEKATEKVNESPFNPGEIQQEKGGELPIFRCYPKVRDPEDITGGYIVTVEKTHRMNGNPVAGFQTGDGLSIRIKEPTYPSRAQTEYLGQRFTEIQHALMTEDGIAPETGKSYEDYLDIASFARKFLIEDWCKNFDFMGGSQYLWKDSDRIDPRIYAGPSWDYDLAFGNMKDRGYLPTGNYITNTRRNANLYWLLSEKEAFREEVKKVWQNEFRPTIAILLGEKNTGKKGNVKSIKEYKREITASASLNNYRWGISDVATAHDSGESFNNAVRYLRDWITERTAYMDQLYGPEAAEKNE